jgi:CheY-like chemotaxis protein
MLFLYVEDDVTNRLVMEMLLTYEIDDARLIMLENSVDFKQKLNTLSPRPDVFLLDIHVQPYDGYEMLKIIRTHPHYTRAKVIAVTASAIGDVIKDLMAAGFDGAINKPIRKDIFGDLIERVVQGEQVWISS